MTDLHCHILPCIDDGAKSVDISIELLRLEHENKITAIAFTPHFQCEKQTFEDFDQKRRIAMAQLTAALGDSGGRFAFKLGAEVAFSPQILELPLDALCIGDTKYILIELPTSYYPAWAKDVFNRLGSKGYTPLLAHVERYSYFLDNPQLLSDLITAGALAQVNASSFLKDRKRVKRLMQFIKWDFVHVVATDAHSPERRAPQLANALEKIAAELGPEKVRQLVENADTVFAGETLWPPNPYELRSFFGVYY